MTDQVFPEFRNQQGDSNYPFTDASTLVESTGLTLDPNMFIDASIYPTGLSAGGQITRIDVTPRSITITIGDRTTKALCSVTFDPLAAAPSPTTLPLVDSLGRPSGILLADPLLLAGLATWSVGTHTFVVGAAEFVASLCIPSPQTQLEGLVTAIGELLADDIWLVGDRGVVLREEGGNIRVDIVGDPLFARRLCFPIDLFTTPRFVKTINKQAPDQYGNFSFVVGNHLVGDTILRIYPIDGGLRFEAVGPTAKG